MSNKNKFRIWDKDCCKYVTEAEFELARIIIKLDEEDGKVFSFDSLFPGRYRFEQFTGLRDRNGKEIYEGDIVEQLIFFVNNEACYTTWIVRWNSDECGWEFHKLAGASYGTSILLSDETEYYEVISNVHEIPELLEEGGEG